MIEKEAKINKEKTALLIQNFKTLGSFKNADFAGGYSEIRLNQRQRERLESLKELVDGSAPIKENWIRFLTIKFVKRHTENIRSLSLDDLIINPFLIKALNLSSPRELIRFSVYHTSAISIVTSMGFTLESMLGRTGARMGRKKEWYDVVKKKYGKSYWIQVKSGPNDVNKDQVVHMSKEFDSKESSTDLPRLGILYGKKTMNTISLNHIKTYLNKWSKRLLIGRELWEFVSDEKNFHKKVLAVIDSVSTNLLKGKSINQEIENAIKRITKEFESRYGRDSKSIDRYIKDVI